MSQFFPFRHCCFVSSGFLQPPAKVSRASQWVRCFSPLPHVAPRRPPIPLHPTPRPVSAERGEVKQSIVLGVPRCRPQRRDGSSRFAGLWQASGTLAARPSQTEPAAPDVRDHGWAGLEAGSGHLRSNAQPAIYAVDMRRFPISRRVSLDGRRPTTRPL
jgi:hypothetical protein